MNGECFFSDGNLDMFYNPDTQIMFFQWKQRTLGEPYRNAFLRGAEYGKDQPTRYFMSDIREQGIVGPDDRKWFEEVAIPKAIDAGVRKVGIIFEGNVFKEYYLNNILSRFKKRAIPMKFFRTEEETIDWLLVEEEVSVG